MACFDHAGCGICVLLPIAATAAHTSRDDAPDFPATTVVGTGTPYKLGRDPFAMDDRGQLIRVAGIG